MATDSTPIRLLRDFVKPGQLITGIELPTDSPNHVLQLLLVDSRDRRIKDFTELASTILGLPMHKCGVVVSIEDYTLVENALGFVCASLAKLLYPKESETNKNLFATEVL